MSKNASQYADDILNAISVISQQNVRDAAFDKTVIATIKSCEDKAIGKYIINYKDINQEAYAINADMKYTPGQLVYVLFPGNNSQRVKTIINTVDHVATTSDNIKDTDQLYNEAGPNIINLGEIFKRNILIEGNIIQLYSYRPLELNEFFLYKKGNDNNIIDINPSDYKYLKEGNSIILTADLRTNIDKSRQAYGQYGIEVVCNFYDNGQQDKIIQKKYTLSNFDVNGYPYTVITKTNIKNLEDFDSQNFIDIESIQAYCYNFYNIANEPIDQRPDIYLYDFAIQGVNRLTDSQLNGYHVNINYSTYGNTINIDENITQILLKGELKIKGSPINQNVNYYWFKQNGTVFKGSALYSSYGGDGWECLNEKNDTGVFYGLTNNQIRFVDSEQEKEKYNDTILTKVLNQKVLRIKCVAIYDIIQQSGIETIYNSNITNDIYIDNSDKKGTENQINYYFNNGSPTLTCVTNVEGEKQYSWSIDYGNGNIEKLEQSEDNIVNIQDDYQKYLKEYEKVSQHQKEEYQEKNEAIINAWNDIKDKEIIKDEKVFNLNISKIKKSATVRCGVSLVNGDNSAYIGTGSITLYNYFEVKDGYSLIIQEGNQVYQYNNDGISPACESIEKPIKIKPLSFALVDPEGHAIPYEQIIANGKVVWCIPNTNTLLIDNNKKDDAQDYNELTGTDRALAANNTYTLYINKESLSYSIADTFDYNTSNNDIRLYIVYKDMIFDEWTNFTFPKSGDPGTNGTKYYAKIYPVYQKDQEKRRLTVDRVYIDSLGNHYDSEGQPWNKVEAVLYNGSIETGNEPSFWSCPIAPSVVNEDALDRSNTSHFQINNNQVILNGEPTTETRLDIIRAQFGTGEQIKYFAEIPICYVYTIGQGNAARYRIKVKEKTGYTYVIYAEDGTNPTHENSDTFELVVEKYNIEQEVYIEQDYDNYTWSVEGNLEIVTTEKNIATIRPLDKFDGKIRKNIIICSIDVGQENPIIIHIPVYMLINRYGHSALNDWDGNSIDLGDDNGGTILAPQVGAGKKNSTDNTFTGLLMGQVKYSDKEETEVGLFGYDKGQRTIFLDAQTGKAEFGKNGSGKIIIDPSKIINGKEAALLYSNNFDEQKYRTNNGKLKDNNGEYITYQVDANDQSGMMIDLTTPQIVFANGKFSVDKKGNLHSASGQIGGWQITPHTLQSTYENKGKVYLNSDGSKVSNKAIKIDSSTKEEIFTVDYAGNLHSEAGDIGGWNISSTSLSNGNVGMQALSGASQKAFYAGAEIDSETHDRPFYVRNDGYLKSSSGKIASWNISTSNLSNNNVGMGEKSFGSSNPFTNSAIDARFWAGSSTKAADLNFVIDSEGTLYSKHGKIGGWSISDSKLLAGTYQSTIGGIELDSTGNIKGGNNNHIWSIGSNGAVSFKEGQIGNWFIKNGAIQNAETNPTLSLSSNGTITGNNGFIGGIKIDGNGLYTDNWRISPSGDAWFNNLYGNIKSGQTLSGSGMSMGGSGGSYIDCGAVTNGAGGDTLDTHIKELAVDQLTATDLTVTGSLKYGTNDAKWKYTGFRINTTKETVTINGQSKTIVTDVTLQLTDEGGSDINLFYLGSAGQSGTDKGSPTYDLKAQIIPPNQDQPY